MKKIQLIGLLICITIILSSCQPRTQVPAKDEEVILLGFSQIGSESGWRDGNTKSIKEAAEHHGITLRFENAEQKQAKQIDAIRSFIAYQVDVIAFSPIVTNGWDIVLQEAKAAGIPVLLCDRYIDVEDDSLYECFIGSNVFNEGKLAADYLLQKTAGMDEVHIVEIMGTLNSTSMEQRTLGFRTTLAPHTQYTVIDSANGDFLRSKGKEAMKALLGRNAHIDVLYSHNDAMTLGAVEAIENAGLVPGKDILIISVDGEQKAIDLLKEGKINCIVECSPMLGNAIMDMTKQLYAGKQIPKTYHIPTRVFTSDDENIQNLPPRGY